jgi:signal-transduction protein with cAMP-binding, CBS, and nucleotidyltransferase domain
LWFIDRKTFKFAIEENIKKNFHENRKFIEKNQFFEYLTPIQKDKIASISMTQKFEKNSKLFKEGDLASSMYIVKEGTLKRFVNGISIGYY